MTIFLAAAWAMLPAADPPERPDAHISESLEAPLRTAVIVPVWRGEGDPPQLETSHWTIAGTSGAERYRRPAGGPTPASVTWRTREAAINVEWRGRSGRRAELKNVALPAGETTRVEVPVDDGVMVRIRAVDAGTGEPVEDVRVRRVWTAPPGTDVDRQADGTLGPLWTRESRPFGTYGVSPEGEVVVPHLRPGEYVAADVAAHGYMPAAGWVVAAPGESAVRLWPAGLGQTRRLAVTDGRGAPAAGVQAWRLDGTLDLEHVRPDGREADGGVELFGTLPDRTTVYVLAEDRRAAVSTLGEIEAAGGLTLEAEPLEVRLTAESLAKLDVPAAGDDGRVRLDVQNEVPGDPINFGPGVFTASGPQACYVSDRAAFRPDGRGGLVGKVSAAAAGSLTVFVDGGRFAARTAPQVRSLTFRRPAEPGGPPAAAEPGEARPLELVVDFGAGGLPPGPAAVSVTLRDKVGRGELADVAAVELIRDERAGVYRGVASVPLGVPAVVLGGVPDNWGVPKTAAELPADGPLVLPAERLYRIAGVVENVAALADGRPVSFAQADEPDHFEFHERGSSAGWSFQSLPDDGSFEVVCPAGAGLLLFRSGGGGESLRVMAARVPARLFGEGPRPVWRPRWDEPPETVVRFVGRGGLPVRQGELQLHLSSELPTTPGVPPLKPAGGAAEYRMRLQLEWAEPAVSSPDLRVTRPITAGAENVVEINVPQA